MEDEFYNLVVKGNDLKTYIRRFQELVFLCPNMVPNTEKLMEVFIKGLPRSIEVNVTASKPQTLEEAINIAQRSYALSWKPCQGDSLNLPDHRYSIYTIKWETGGLDDGVAASFQRSRIHKPHAHTHAFKDQAYRSRLTEWKGATTASSLRSREDSGNITRKTQSMATLNEPNS
ncbi:hypothetical protein Tco_0526927 [Tanacetum coccineum]